MAKATAAKPKTTRTRKAPAEPKIKRDIPIELRCHMCHDNGQLEESMSDYEFKHMNEKHLITNVPCMICDTCGGRKFNSDDITRPVSYMKANGHREVDYAEIMEIYWSWQRSVRATK